MLVCAVGLDEIVLPETIGTESYSAALLLATEL